MTVRESTSQPIQRVSALTAKLSALLDDTSDGVHVSLYQSTGRDRDASERARAQLKQQLGEAQHRAEADARGQTALQSLFAEAKELMDDRAWWERQKGGLALFLQEGRTEALTVREPFDERLVVSCQFYLKPLMALAANVDAYHLLVLNAHDIRLMRGSALGIRDMETDQLPATHADALLTLGYEAETAGDRERLRAVFGEINDATTRTLVDSEWPLLLAGPPEYEPLYREVNTYPHLSEAYLPGNPEKLGLEELHEQASACLKHDFIASQKRALLRLAKKEDPDAVITDIAEVLLASQQGRVTTLVVPHDEDLWGTFDRDDQTVLRSREAGMSDTDLYEMAARLTLDSGGEVFFIQANQIPHGADIMAKIRQGPTPSM